MLSVPELCAGKICAILAPPPVRVQGGDGRQPGRAGRGRWAATGGRAVRGSHPGRPPCGMKLRIDSITSTPRGMPKSASNSKGPRIRRRASR